MADADLVAAARAEVESRERHYPKLVASSRLTADEATIDFQAWHCIAHFIETGRFEFICAGGIDGRTVVDWVLAQAAADRAVTVTTAALESAAGDDPKVARLTSRLEALRAIARLVARQRQRIESLNRALRERTEHSQTGRKAA